MAFVRVFNVVEDGRALFLQPRGRAPHAGDAVAVGMRVARTGGSDPARALERVFAISAVENRAGRRLSWLICSIHQPVVG